MLEMYSNFLDENIYLGVGCILSTIISIPSVIWYVATHILSFITDKADWVEVLKLPECTEEIMINFLIYLCVPLFTFLMWPITLLILFCVLCRYLYRSVFQERKIEITKINDTIPTYYIGKD